MPRALGPSAQKPSKREPRSRVSFERLFFWLRVYLGVLFGLSLFLFLSLHIDRAAPHRYIVCRTAAPAVSETRGVIDLPGAMARLAQLAGPRRRRRSSPTG